MKLPVFPRLSHHANAWHKALIALVISGCSASAQTTAGTALQFDGSNSYVKTITVTGGGGTGITLEAWIKPTDLFRQGDQVVLRQGTHDLDDWVLKFTRSGTCLYFGVFTALTWGPTNLLALEVPIDVNAMMDGRWHYVAGTYDHHIAYVCLDGSPIGAWAGDRDILSQYGSVGIGAGFDGTTATNFFTGSIDEVRVWTGSDTLDGLCGSMNRPLVVTQWELAGYWRFDEGSGETTANSSLFRQQDAILVNSPTWIVSGAFQARPVVMTLVASNVAPFSADLTGSASMCGYATSGWFEFGTTTSYGQSTPTLILLSGSSSPVIQTITNLTADTTYHFRCLATNQFGTNVGGDMEFTTPGRAQVVTLPAGQVGSHSATLEGTVNPDGADTAAWFEWGTTSSYGSSTTHQPYGSGTSPWQIVQGIAGLVAHQEYHYRVVATNAAGPAVGQDQVFTTLFEAPQVLWTYDAGQWNSIMSTPAVGTNGNVYFAAGTGLHSVTNSDGVASDQWVFPIDLLSGSSPAISAEGTIYIVGGTTGSLYAVNPDGSQRWAYPMGGGSSSPAIGFDNTIYVHGGGNLHAVLPTGTAKWRHPVAGTYWFGSPSIAADGTIHIASLEASAVFAINPDGSEKWSVPTAPWLISETLALGFEGNVYFASGSLTAVLPNSRVLWNFPLPYAKHPASVGADGTIYLASGGSGSLYAVSSQGLLQWVTFLVDEDWTNTPPIVAPAIDSLGTIYHAAVHNLFAISSGGAVKWIFNPPGDPWSYARTPPVIAPDGTILAAFGTRVYALAGAHPPADTAWPMYRQNPRHTGKVERPSLQKAKETSDATFQFQLFGQISNTFTIEVSTNLPTWTALTSFVATNVPMGVVDSDATGSPVKFYRALQTQ